MAEALKKSPHSEHPSVMTCGSNTDQQVSRQGSKNEALVSSQPTPEEFRRPAGWNNSCNPPSIGALELLDGVWMKESEGPQGDKSVDFELCNNEGTNVLFAAEDSNCCMTRCCGRARSFTIEVSDLTGAEMFEIERTFICPYIPLPWCTQRVTVRGPTGERYGVVRERWSYPRLRFNVEDGDGDIVYSIRGPMCRCKRCGGIQFRIESAGGEAIVGKISTRWSGSIHEAFKGSQRYGLKFDRDIDPKIKATLIGALFLVDVLFYEKRPIPKVLKKAVRSDSTKNTPVGENKAKATTV